MSEIHQLPDRRNQNELVELIREAVREAVAQVESNRCLSEQEQEWVRKAIEAEARKIRFRDAVIEKSLAGLVWGAIVFIGAAVWHTVKSAIVGGQ